MGTDYSITHPAIYISSWVHHLQLNMHRMFFVLRVTRYLYSLTNRRETVHHGAMGQHVARGRVAVLGLGKMKSTLYHGVNSLIDQV